MRELIEGKTKVSAKKSVGGKAFRRITLMHSLGSRESLNGVKDIDRLVALTENEQYQVDRR